MNDMQAFATRRDALAEIETMRGWVARPARMNVATDDDRYADLWVIECHESPGQDPCYLREDGYVR